MQVQLPRVFSYSDEHVKGISIIINILAKTMSMIVRLICFFILGLYLISLQIRIKIKGSIDVPAKEGEVSFSVFYITIFRAEGLLKGDSPIEGDFVLMKKRKEKSFHFDIKKLSPAEVVRFIRSIDLSFLSNLDVREVYLSLHYGDGDALKTTLLLSLARVGFYSVMSALKSKQDISVCEEFVPMYNNRTLKADFHGIFTLSIADIIYGYLSGRIKRLRRFLRIRLARIKAAKLKRLKLKPLMSLKPVTNQAAKAGNKEIK